MNEWLNEDATTYSAELASTQELFLQNIKSVCGCGKIDVK